MEGNSEESRLEDILSLVIARSKGEVGNEEVENALASIVPAPVVPNQNVGLDSKFISGVPGDNSLKPNKNGIIEDTDNYDFDDDNKDAEVKPAAPIAISHEEQQIRKKGRQKSSERLHQDALENIPLGKMGSRMLITFGDGPQPRPDVVSAALLGARSSLQRAVLDARALHRRLRDQWHHARATATQHVKGTQAKNHRENIKGAVSTSDLIVDNELSFRALEATWERNNIPCGFDVKSLDILFPEEMNAYQRWKKMHDAYTENSSDEIKSRKFTGIEEDNIDLDNNKIEINNDADDILESSRLYERLGNFDARTTHMKPDLYMKFSDVRKGSFLPRKKLSNETKEWAKANRKAGRPSTKNRTTWTNLHPSSVVFLHWLGFDPMSSLPPPDEETTQVLGFLAHDFLGKIVEKAVIIHLKESKSKNHDNKSILPELSGDEQLHIEDIQRAINETSLKSLYSIPKGDIGKSSQVAQLYFGPGFEDRLELELEEMFGAKDKRLTPEELKIREEEETLFSDLAAPPSVLHNYTNTAGSNEDEDSDANTSPVGKRQRRTNN